MAWQCMCTLKDKSSPSVDQHNRKNIKKNQTEQWKFDENQIKNKEDVKNFVKFSQNSSWTVDMNMQISELMMSSPHNFTFNLFTEMTNLYFI